MLKCRSKLFKRNAKAKDDKVHIGRNRTNGKQCHGRIKMTNFEKQMQVIDNHADEANAFFDAVHGGSNEAVLSTFMTFLKSLSKEEWDLYKEPPIEGAKDEQ